MTHIESLRRYHREQIEPLIGAPLGCEPEEVDRLEAELGYSVPAAYREFLLWMGRDRRGVFVGSDCFIEHILENNELLPELLEENNVQFSLPDRYIAFFTHQGYIAAWFPVSGHPDPISWCFNESTMSAPEEQGPFTAFILAELIANAELTRESHERRG